MKSFAQEKSVRMRCPECSNFIDATVKEGNGLAGECPYCKSIIFSKQHSPREKLIRIVKRA